MDPRLNNTGRAPPGLDQDSPLEDRLRNMILGHNPPGVTHSEALPEPGQPDRLAQAEPKASRGKRPNQAQRRQMNAQLSIPIDTRPPDQWSVRQSGQGPAAMYHRTNDFHHGGQGRQHPPSFVPRGSLHQGQHQGRGQGPHSHHFGRGQPGQQSQFPTRGRGHARGNMFNPHDRRAPLDRPEDIGAQLALLDGLCNTLVAGAEIERADIAEKEAFRLKIEDICRQVISDHEEGKLGREGFPSDSVALRCFGSLASGFATKASDMDLGLISPLSEPQPYDADSEIPRLVEKAFLEHGYGARLLAHTRVPIIKVCEKPTGALMHALKEKRTQWEHGVEDTPDAAYVTEAGDDADLSKPEEQHIGDQHVTVPQEASSPRTRVPRRRHSSKQDRSAFLLARIQQGEAEPLPTYQAVAKRVLHELGGFDITVSNYQDFEQNDFEVLLSVCRAFVDGLHDEKIKRDVLSYPSISSSAISAQGLPVWLSLHGVGAQVQGARLVRNYRESKAQQAAPRQNRFAEDAIAEWLDLQHKPDFGMEPLLYMKQMVAAHDKLKKIPSVQLHSLQQEQYESAVEYFQRAIRIIAGVKPKYEVEQDDFARYVVDRYVAGIFNPSLREQVHEFAQSNNLGPMPVLAVSRRHKSLHLAMELEKAAKAQAYGPELLGDIEEYMSILRGPLVQSSSPLDLVVPEPSPHLLAVISKLKNPAKLTANLPPSRYRDAVEFPKSGVGVQCDINFSAHLALQNTTLLRCYSHTDPRVRPLVLFVKHWAKRRGINTPYRGTLSSYGYVLMMLHYLVNVVQPFVCPNLQALGPPLPGPIDATGRLVPQPGPDGSPAHPPFDETVACRGRFVGFWRDEAAIQHLSAAQQLNGNRDSIGRLLRGFFEYYAQNGPLSSYVGVSGFDWGREVISIRTPRGIIPKQAKGWTGAKTVIEVRGRASPEPGAPLPSPGEASLRSQPPSANMTNGKAPTSTGGGGEIKEIRNRYLFAIEDPFEHDHNVARTVTHKGIVSIRDEFRRAWRIIKATTAEGPALSRAGAPEELLEDAEAAVDREEENAQDFADLLADLHGLVPR